MRKVYSRLSAEERVRIDEMRNREDPAARSEYDIYSRIPDLARMTVSYGMGTKTTSVGCGFVIASYQTRSVATRALRVRR